MVRMGDLVEASIGAFTAVIFIVAIRSGDPIEFDPTVGFIITLIWGFLLFKRAKKLNFGRNFFQNVIVTVLISYVLAMAFDLLGDVNVFSFAVFGSALVVLVWIALPVALLFDKFNLKSPLARIFIRGRG